MPLPRGESWVPRAAVAAVSVAAVMAAVMVERAEPVPGSGASSSGVRDRQAANTLPAASAAMASTPGQTSASAATVVRAPPLKAPQRTPARSQAARETARETARAGADNTMGAAPACANCGVVEAVVALREHEKPEASAYQMHIRMDDGSTRTIEQRGALAAGSRVVVENGQVRALVTPG